MTSQATRKIRVLCLHGWRTNANILRHQTQGLRDALGERAEFMFLNAPFPASGPAQDAVQTFYAHEAPFYEWWNAVRIAPSSVDAAPATASKPASTYRYEGVDETLRFLMEQVDTLGPIDVLLGFSQGAGVATALTAHWKTQRQVLPWKACVLFCGFRPRGEGVSQLFEDEFQNRLPVELPSIHILGRADTLFPKSEELVDAYANEEEGVRRVQFFHEEGHKFPSISRHKDLYADVAAIMQDMVSSPTGGIPVSRGANM